MHQYQYSVTNLVLWHMPGVHCSANEQATRNHIDLEFYFTSNDQSKADCKVFFFLSKYPEEVLQHLPTTEENALNILWFLNDFFNCWVWSLEISAWYHKLHTQNSIRHYRAVKQRNTSMSALQFCEHWDICTSFPLSHQGLRSRWISLYLAFIFNGHAHSFSSTNSGHHFHALK